MDHYISGSYKPSHLYVPPDADPSIPRPGNEPKTQVDTAGGRLFYFLTRCCMPIAAQPRIAVIASLIHLFSSLIRRSTLANEVFQSLEVEDDAIAGILQQQHEPSSNGVPADLGVALDTTRQEYGPVPHNLGDTDGGPELERLFLMALTWAVGGLLEDRDRKRFDLWLRYSGAPLPDPTEAMATVFDGHVDLDSIEWRPWQVPAWKFPDAGRGLKEKPHHDGSVAVFDIGNLVVPTKEIERSCALLSTIFSNGMPVLVSGSSGTGKTTIINTALARLSSSHRHASHRINLTAMTQSPWLQAEMESLLERKGGRYFGPLGGKPLSVFIDDLALPSVCSIPVFCISSPSCYILHTLGLFLLQTNEWGDKPVLEFLRQLVEYRTIAFLEKDKRGDMKHLEGVSYVAATSHNMLVKEDASSQSGSSMEGSNDLGLPARLQRHFFILNVVPPSAESVRTIFGALVKGRFAPVEGPEGKLLVPFACVALPFPHCAGFASLLQARTFRRKPRRLLIPPPFKPLCNGYPLPPWKYGNGARSISSLHPPASTMSSLCVTWSAYSKAFCGHRVASLHQRPCCCSCGAMKWSAFSWTV